MRIIRTWAAASAVALFICLGVAQAQTPQYDGDRVSVSRGPHSVDYTKLYFYDGSNNLEYICVAYATQPTFTWRVSDTTLTSIVVASTTGTVTTSSAHGLQVGNLVTVANATVDTDLNGTYYVQSTPTSTTFTVTVSGVTAATYNESTLNVSTAAPRSSAAIWKIFKNIYSGSLLTREASSPFGSICDNRSTTTGATKVTYR